jgi:hypothetical protein
MEALVVERPGSAGSNSAPESSKSAVSWPAIIAGAVAATAASVLLLTLGSGFGLISASVWPGSGASAGKVIALAAIWFIVVQWIASFLGGYLTGRLRTKWVGTHTHEVFFRDTANGFIAWALATLLLACVFASASAALARMGAHGAARMGAGAASAMAQGSVDAPGGPGGAPMAHEEHGPMGGPGAAEMAHGPVSGYDVDVLFRSAQPESSMPLADVRAEAARILMKAGGSGEMPPADRDYLSQLIAARTGIAPADAQRRIDDAFAQLNAAVTKARQAAEDARKAAATTSIFIALSMLIGAFIACAAAALGGHERDLHP